MKSWFFFLIFSTLFSGAWGTMDSASLNFDESTLSNGMKVCLTRTTFEKNMLCLEVFASGGSAALSPEDRPSGLLAIPILWESGIGKLNSAELSTFLYEHSIEMQINIRPFDRSIAIRAPSLQLNACIQIIKDVFTHSNFDPLAVDRAKILVEKEIEQKITNPDSEAKEFFMEVNMQKWDRLSPLTTHDLDNVELKKAEHFFKQSFSNPKEFTCVIIGDFDVASLKETLESQLSPLLSTPSATPLITPPNPLFPSEITKRDKNLLKNTKQSITQITFPLSAKITPDIIDRLRNVCQLVYTNIHVHLSKCDVFHPRFQVKYEFPKYPLIDQTWLSIAFASDPENAELLTNEILNSLQNLKKDGPSSEMMAYLTLKRIRNDNVWEEDNDSLLTLIANFYRWQWDLKTINKYIPNPSYQKPSPLKRKLLQDDINLFINLEQYSILTAYPIEWRAPKND